MVPVQPLSVNGVHRVFHDLQPVDGQHGTAHHANRAFGHKAIEARQQRPGLRAEVGKQQAAQFLHRIGVGGDLVAEGAVVRLVGLIQAFALGAELPAVIRAANPVLGGNTVRKRGPAVRTLLGDQTQPPLPVLEQHQILAQQPDAPGPVLFDLDRCRYRLPITPHQLSHGRSSPDLGQEFVLLCTFHLFFLPDDLRVNPAQPKPDPVV